MSNQPQVGYLLKQAQALLRLRMEDALKPLDLTVSQYSCLHSLRRDPGISAAALARSVFMTRQSMSAMLQQLIDRGFVTRPQQPTSGRALPTALTPTGDDALDAAQQLITEVEQRMLGSLSTDDRAALAVGLAACVEALSD